MKERFAKWHVFGSIARIIVILQDILKVAREILAAIGPKPPVRAVIVFGPPTPKQTEKN